MTQVKQPKGARPKEKPQAPQASQKYIAAAGKIQPIYYKGSIVFIGSGESVEIDHSALAYQSKTQLDRAIIEGDLIKVEET